MENKLTNTRNSFGFKDCGDCYRRGGQFVQWIDCQEKHRATVKIWAKQNHIPYKITRLSDGMIRLFVDLEIARNAPDCPINNGE